MADYQLTDTDIVLRSADQVYIPNDTANYDRRKYDEWLLDGGVPDPVQAPNALAASVALASATLPTAAQIAAGTGNMTQIRVS